MLTQRLDRKQQWLYLAVSRCDSFDNGWLRRLLSGDPFAAQQFEQACETEMADVVKADRAKSATTHHPAIAWDRLRKSCEPGMRK